MSEQNEAVISQDAKYTTLIPRALLGPAAPKPKPEPSRPWSDTDCKDSRDYLYDWTPDITSSRGPQTNRGMEPNLREDIQECFHPEFYAFKTSPDIHQSAVDIAASEEVSKLFGELNDTVGEVGDRGTVKVSMVTKICELGESVRQQLNAGNVVYGKLIPKGQSTTRTTGEKDQDRDVKVDILVQAWSPSPTASDPEPFRWSNAVSFIEVKAKDDVDWRDRLILQIARYAGKIYRYRPIISHLQCVTWCGHTVRLWYFNAGLLACSRPFDTRDRNDQIEIVKILRLLCLEEHSALLSGRWDVAAQKIFDVETDGEVSPPTAKAKVQMEALEVRSGPYGSRTAVFADRIESDEKVLMLKVSWLAEPLRSREMEMLRGIQSVGLPYAPELIGLAKVSTTGFQSRPCGNLGISPSSARGVSALLTKQHAGDHIGSQVSVRDLLNIHIQLAEQLLTLAEAEYHYRDLNEGNIRVLHGHTDTLLLVDFGNMRKEFSPGAHSGMTYAEAMLDRATDDTRSASPMFLPTCCFELKLAIDRWESEIEEVQGDFQRAIDGDPSNGLRSGLQLISATLPHFRRVLRLLAMKAHRYIDDLESALYLHLWTRTHSVVEKERVFTGLLDRLQDLCVKRNIWENRSSWLRLVSTYCPTASKAWTNLMRELRKTIHNARKELDEELADRFDAIESLKLDSLQSRLTVGQWGLDAKPKDIISELFDVGDVLEGTGLHDVERRCFQECMSLMRAAVDSGQEM